MKLEKLSKDDFQKLMGNDEIPDVNRNIITLQIFEFNCPADEISKRLDLVPDSFGLKGEEYFIGPSNNRIRKIRECSHWEFKVEVNSNEFIGDLVEKFLEEYVIPRKYKLIELGKENELQFQIVQYYYDGCNPGICIEPKYLKLLGEINANLNFDIYSLSE